MSNFSSFIMTDSGRSIVAKANAQQENAIVYTKFVCSENRYTADDIPQLETIDNINQEVAVSSVTYQAPDMASISAKLTSSDVKSGYYLQTIVVYAKNKIDNEEKLYAVSIETEPEKADWISPSSSINIIDTLITANFIIARAQISKIEIVPAGTVSIDQFNEHVNNEGINRVHGCTPEPNINSIVSRDGEGSSNVNMPSNIENTTIVNNEYLQTELSKKQNKLTAGTNIEITEGNVINIQGDVATAATQVTQSNEALGENVQTALDILELRFMIDPYYIQYALEDGTFDSNEEPSVWFKKMYNITTTWQIMFNTESIYFRTEGDLANVDRIDGIQGDAGRNATGRAGFYYGFRDNTYGYGVLSAVKKNDSGAPSGGGVGVDDKEVNIDLSRAYTTANEFRVKNRLIRIYKLLTINGKTVNEILQGA